MLFNEHIFFYFYYRIERQGFNAFLRGKQQCLSLGSKRHFVFLSPLNTMKHVSLETELIFWYKNGNNMLFELHFSDTLTAVVFSTLNPETTITTPARHMIIMHRITSTFISAYNLYIVWARAIKFLTRMIMICWKEISLLWRK